MSITRDIARTYLHPRQVITGRARGADEVHAIGILLVACGIIFISQLPVLAREAYFDPSQPLEARIAGAAMGLLMILPLMIYGLAALVGVISRLFGNRAGFFPIRFAIFWALLAATPMWLLNGLTHAMVGPGIAERITAALTAAVFIGLSGIGIHALTRPMAATTTKYEGSN